MRKTFPLIAIVLVSCTAAAKEAVGVSPEPTPAMELTVQHKIPPDTLVRGDGAICVVRPAVKYAIAELGKTFICDWVKKYSHATSSSRTPSYDNE